MRTRGFRFLKPDVSRSLRNGNKISRQYNFHFQNFIVVAFPTESSVLRRFSSLPPRPPPSKVKILFLLSSPSLSLAVSGTKCPTPGWAPKIRTKYRKHTKMVIGGPVIMRLCSSIALLSRPPHCKTGCW